MPHILNLDAIAATEINTTPYPYFVSENAVISSELGSLLANFPKIRQGGSFPLDSLDLSPIYQQLVEEFSGDQVRKLVEEKFSIDLTDRPVMITARGFSRAKDGRIHTDSKTKLVTLLLYLNENWNAKTGNLRILQNGNSLEDYVQEVPSKAGTLLGFKVTENCWHGYVPYEGKRCSLQINYITDNKAANKHHFVHQLSSKIKKWFR